MANKNRAEGPWGVAPEGLAGLGGFRLKAQGPKALGYVVAYRAPQGLGYVVAQVASPPVYLGVYQGNEWRSHSFYWETDGETPREPEGFPRRIERSALYSIGV